VSRPGPPGAPIRVAEFVRSTHGFGYLVGISAGLWERGYEVHAIVGGSEGRLTRALEAAGMHVHVLRVPAISDVRIPGRFGWARRPLYATRLLWASVRLARLLRREQIDVLHSHTFISILIARLAGWFARTPVRISMVPGPSHLLAPLPRTIDRATWRLDNRVVASCDYTAALYEAMGLPERRSARIYYGADPRQFDPAGSDGGRVRRELGIPPEVPLVGLIAYYYPPNDRPGTPPMLRGRGLKGHEYLIEAAPLVLEEFPEARFLLVGDGARERGEEYRRQLEERTLRMGLGDRFLFTGFRSDIPDVLAALDVAVQCSLMENLGGTIESLLMETPTVASRVGGMPESVRDGETGVLVPAADSEALARAILDLLRDPERARRLARAGRELMLARFTLQRTVADIDTVFREEAAHLGAD
jgi:glycosyltransferase involved in cell wall biosynthesis